MQDLLTEEFLEKVTAPLYEVAVRMSNSVVGIIADRIKEIGTLLPSDVTRLRNSMLLADFKKIEQAIAELTGQGIEEIEAIFDAVATENEEMARVLYEYRDVKQIPYKSHDTLSKVVESAIKSATDDFLHLSNTTAVGFSINHKFYPLKKAYNVVIDNAVFAVNQGTVDYNTAIRKIVSEMAGGGLQVVYESGYKRRLDSAVRMNVLDGCRQMNLSFREQQSKEYGADGWEISAHANCRPDHQSAQGRVFSFKEFEELQNRLETPIATGEMNCRHTKVGVIMDINVPAYTDKQLQKLNDDANEKVKFKGLSGKELEASRYDCTQYMRMMETAIRDQRYIEEALKRTGDKIGEKQARQARTLRIREYQRICGEMGLPPRLNRL